MYAPHSYSRTSPTRKALPKSKNSGTLLTQRHSNASGLRAGAYNPKAQPYSKGFIGGRPTTAQTRGPSPVKARVYSPMKRASQSPTLKKRFQAPDSARRMAEQRTAGSNNYYTPVQQREFEQKAPKTANQVDESNLVPYFSQMKLGEDADGGNPMFSWNSANRQKEPSELKKMPTYHPADIEWTEEEVKQSRQFATKHINLKKNAYEDDYTSFKGTDTWQLNNKITKQEKWVCAFCGPSCLRPHEHNFEYDFNKNYLDPLHERPGIDFILEPKIRQEMKKAKDLSQPCYFGNLQTPIDLSTQMHILQDFKDKEFAFNYEPVTDVKKQLKFNQGADQWIYDIAKGKPEQKNPNFMKTETISLFDPHIPVATLHGVQFHFHAPSEHSIDGQLMDLEMHIVHLLDSKREHNNAQFGAGVLGFLFKVVPEEYFIEMNVRYPQADMEWHDKFMAKLVEDEKNKKTTGFKREELDLQEFVEKVNFNKRWTYQGSLTTAPCDEGILWNVVEGVIPIRQSTLDAFVYMRKVEEQQITNPISKIDPATVQFLEELKEDIPASKKSQKEGGNTFMRVAGCNRKVQDVNGRKVYRIDLQD